MREHIKKHDLRDEIYAPRTSVTSSPQNKPYDDPNDDATPADSTGTLATPDKGAVTGQTTHM